MSDIMVRVWAKDAGLRGLACVTTETAREAAQRHAAYPIAAAALTHGLTAGLLLGGLLKVQERVALKVEGDGPLRKLVVEADAYGHVRGYVAVPDAPFPGGLDADAVSATLGHHGLLTVVKDLRVRDLYRSVVELSGLDLAGELENYLNRSEQIPSLVRIGVQMDEQGTVAAAGGLLIQTMPGHEPAILARLTTNLAALPPMEALLRAGLGPEDVLARAFADITYETLETRPLSFRCSCSRERSRQALEMMTYDDILALLLEGQAVVDCHFCHARYEFDRDELEEILHKIEGADRPQDV